MARIALYKDNYADSTVVSNLFIDEYMKDANDAQLKVYFYLLRMLNAEQAISVSGIADKFNHTEKDVIRALKYWEKQQILDLDFDDNKTLVGIHLRDLSTQAAPAPQHNVLLTSGPSQMQNTPAGVSVIPAAAIPQVSAAVVPTTPQETVNPYAKPAYSLDQLREFKEREETSQLLFIAEAYIGKPLTPSEIKTILFFTDRLSATVLCGARQERFQIHRKSCCQLGGRRNHHPEAGAEILHPLRQKRIFHYEQLRTQYLSHSERTGIHQPLDQRLRFQHRYYTGSL